MRLRSTAFLSELFLVMCCSAVLATDSDGDGLQDADEQRWLNAHAPILYTHETNADFQSGVGIPVDLEWLLQNSVISEDTGLLPIQLLVRPTTQEAIDFLRTYGDSSLLLIALDERYGDVDGNPRTWPLAVQNGYGTYGRAWRPYGDDWPNLVSLQYYMYTTWNETAFSGGEGNHEGDWTCLDLTVDTSINADKPPIIHAVMFNHSRELFLTPEAMRFENGRPQIFAELGSWEFWPNPGPRGKPGWPQRDGWATNADLDFACDDLDWFTGFFCSIGGVSEFKVSREHEGNGWRLDWLAGDGNVDNIGDNGTSLCGPSGEFIQLFAGRWGAATGGTFNPGTVPFGPPFQRKFWHREFVGPWSPPTGPFPVSAPDFVPITGGFTFVFPVRRSTVYVDGAAPDAGRGDAQRPYRDIDLGLAMTAGGGTVVAAPGSYRWDGAIDRVVSVQSPDGSSIIVD